MTKKIQAEWIPRLDFRIQETIRIRDNAVTGAQADVDRALGYQHNRDLNESMVQALRLYRETLEKELKQCQKSVNELRKTRAFVQNTCETVSNAGEVLSLFRESRDALNGLSSLQLPDFDMSGGVNLREQFQEITRNLADGKMREADFGKTK